MVGKMALETVVFQQDLFGFGCRDIYTSLGGAGEDEEAYNETLSGFNSNHWDSSPFSMGPNNVKDSDTNSSFQENCAGDGFFTGGFSAAGTSGRRKRKRSISVKNQKEVEHQRMTHINVERNRRKQMNDYLAVLRSMMPASYVQRGDQASIVGGAINIVKELEQLQQSLEAHKRIKKESSDSRDFSRLFSEFFTFPQYSTRSTTTAEDHDQSSMAAKRQSISAEVEVTMIESHANLKILTRRHPKQLLKMVVGLYSHCLSILHLNVTSVDQMVLYSFSVKVEEECQLTSVNEIAAAVYEMVARMQKEAISNLSCDC
ncbi:transcription factor bHLH94 [Hevea brasiliensis]|uniref:transcription factor bHLH94 n=1 Tax=Hevea brasiliensis TaxID=3981 RepID=UPI0025F0B07B|nr:transcription factor bHLH94 [Hevea brasiliensis]